MKVKNKIKKDPLGSLDDIEKKLDSDPYNVEANSLFYEAFMALGIPEIATFGLETIREGHPSDTKNLHKLGDHFLAQGDGAEAAKVYDSIVEKDPSDGDARKKAKDASAQATMAKVVGESKIVLLKIYSRTKMKPRVLKVHLEKVQLRSRCKLNLLTWDLNMRKIQKT